MLKIGANLVHAQQQQSSMYVTVFSFMLFQSKQLQINYWKRSRIKKITSEHLSYKHREFIFVLDAGDEKGVKDLIEKCNA